MTFGKRLLNWICIKDLSQNLNALCSAFHKSLKWIEKTFKERIWVSHELSEYNRSSLCNKHSFLLCTVTGDENRFCISTDHTKMKTQCECESQDSIHKNPCFVFGGIWDTQRTILSGFKKAKIFVKINWKIYFIILKLNIAIVAYSIRIELINTITSETRLLTITLCWSAHSLYMCQKERVKEKIRRIIRL